MEKNEILEGNCLIVEFMNVQKHPRYKKGEDVWMRHKEYRVEPFGYFDADDLKYHSSWDWLMPVVEKINILAINNEGEMGVYINPNIVTIGENEHHPICMITIANHPTLIEMVWFCIVTFIRWYNTNNPTSINKQ